MSNDSLGSFGRHVLLTGAGWSRNWGAPLASEIWQSLIGHDAVQGNPRLLELLRKELSFEVAFGRTQGPEYTHSDRTDLQRALLDTFVSIDREIARTEHEPGIPIYNIQNFLFRFSDRRNQGIDTGYLFTLNQDLFFERNLYNEYVWGAPPGSLPGIEVKPNGRWFRADIEPYSDEFIRRPAADSALRRLSGHMNVIKLHGSFNWRTNDDRDLMVVGTAKTAQIASLPLLDWYAKLFKQVLTVGGVRLMTIGYGFGDAHINAIIADAIEHHGLQIFIWNCDPDLKRHVEQSPQGDVIWSKIISTATRPLAEVFPSNQDETTEYQRIIQSFFKDVSP